MTAQQAHHQAHHGAKHGAKHGADHGSTPDAVLLACARDGDDDAFAELYRRHALTVRRQVRGDGLDAHTAEDLTDEAFTRTLGAVRRGGGPTASVRDHLLVSVRRLAAGRSAAERRERAVADVAAVAAEAAAPTADRPARHVLPADSAPGEDVAPVFGEAWPPAASAEAQALDEADRALLVRAFRELPRRWRDVLWRTAVEQQSLSEVSAALELTPNATAVLAHRAREGLRQAYLQAHVNDSLTDRQDCRRYARRLGALVRGTTCSRRLRLHLDDCDRCRAAYLELVDVNATLRGLVPFAAVAWCATTAAPPASSVAWTSGLAGTGTTATGLGGVGGLLGKVAVGVATTVALAAGSAAPTATGAEAGTAGSRPVAAVATHHDAAASPDRRPAPDEAEDAGPSEGPDQAPPDQADAGPASPTGLLCLSDPDGQALSLVVLDLGCPVDTPPPLLPILTGPPTGADDRITDPVDEATRQADEEELVPDAPTPPTEVVEPVEPPEPAEDPARELVLTELSEPLLGEDAQPTPAPDPSDDPLLSDD